MDKQQAAYLLRDVDDGVTFRFKNGRSAKNLRELSVGVMTLRSEEYAHHVHFDHNDLSNWLLDIVGDNKLARDLFNAKQHHAEALLRARIRYLESWATSS